MTAPGGGANLNATLSLNAQQFIKSANEATQALRGLSAQMQAGIQAQGKQTAAQRQAETQLARQLKLYQQLASITNTYVTATTKAGSSSASAAAGLTTMTNALQHMQTALGQVAGTSQKAFAAQSRTLTLYQQLATVTNTYADTNLKLARTEQANAAAANQNALATKRATTASQGHTTGLGQERYALYEVAAAYGVVAVGLGKLALGPVQVSSAFEDAFADVERVLGPTGTVPSALSLLYNQLQGIAEEVPVAFEDLAGIESLGAQLGIANEDLTAFTDTIAKFGAVTNVSVDQAALAFGRISNLLHVPSSDFDKLASAIAYVGATSAATESEILAVTQGIAGAAGAAGIAAPEVIGFSGALASLKIPPEMARGVFTRLFAQFNKDAAEGGTRLQTYAKYLDMTASSAANLLKQNPGAFFQSLVKGISEAVDNGANLTTVLGEIGVKNVRDVNVIQRLVGSYDLLSDSVVNANVEFQKGSFLQDAAAIRFDTTAKKLELARNAIRNFAADTGDLANKTFGAVLLPVLDKVLDVFNAIPSPIKSSVLALAAIVAGVAAYRAALALAIAGTIAFRQVLQSTLGVSGAAVVSLGSLMTAIRGTGAAAGAATAQVTGLGRAVGFLGGWVGVVLTTLATVGVALYAAFQDSNHAAEEAAAHAAEMKQTFLDAAGGAEALASAIKQDSDALGESNGAFKAGAGVTAEYTRTIKDLHNGQAEIIDQWVDAKGKALVGEEATTRVVNYSDSVLDMATNTDAASLATANLRIQSGLTADQLDRETIAIGKNAAALQAKALAEQFYATGSQEGKTPLLNSASQAALEAKLNDLGTTLSEAVAQALSGDNSKIKAALASLEADIDQQIARKQAEIDAAAQRVRMDAGGQDAKQTQRDKARQEALEAERAQLEATKVGWENLADAVGVARDKTLDFAGSGDFLSGVLKALGLDDAADQAGDAADGISEIGSAASDAAPSLSDLASSFSDLVSSMFEVTNNTAAVYEALETLGKGLADSTDFSAYTEAGRKNLQNLQATVEAYGATLSKAIEDGNLTAEQAAVQMQDYVNGLVQSLASKGVDTSQLDFLVQYVSQIVNQPWLMPVGADISAAVAGLDTINDYAKATYDAIASLGMSAAATQSGANIIEGARVQGYVAPNYVPRFSTASYGGPTSFPGAQQGGFDPSDVVGQAKKYQEAANAADDLAAAQKDAGGAAKQAGKDATDAADQASDAAKKQAEYVKDLADWYAKLGSATLTSVKNEGDVFAGLQDLGHQIAESGTNFDTFSESGRKNFEALGSVLDAFGSTLQEKVSAGTLDAASAMQQFQQFAGGVRSDLIAAGVPAQQIAGYFDALGATANGWKGVSEEVHQYAGQVQGAADYSKKFGDAAKAANDEAAEAVKQHLAYLKDLGAAYANMGTSIFTFANATGQVFESLQNLGAAIAENGVHFNVVTAAGRANFAALSKTIDDFGSLLEARVTNGLITAGQAEKQMAQFAGGVYKELIRLGVPAKEINAYFKSLGISTSGFAHASAAVAQFAGVLTNAAAAARAAAQGTNELSTALMIAEDWASRLGDAFSTAFTRLYGLDQARDSVTSAILDMRDAAQAAKDKIEELRDANAKLNADLLQANADKMKATTLKAIADKYGDTNRSAQYGADIADADQRAKDAKKTIAANKKESDAIKKNTGVLVGNTREAIENRNSVRELQQQMYEQIAAYAATGATTQQVEQYTKDLKKQFISTGTQLGYSRQDLKKYSDAFDTYAKLVKNTPKVITTKVNADTSSAEAALKALPDNQKYTIVATAETTAAKNQLTALPDKQDYVVTAKTANVPAVTSQLTHIPKTGTYAVSASVVKSTVTRMLAAIPKQGDYKVNIKVPGGAAAGGVAAAKSAINRGLAGFTPTIGVKVTIPPLQTIRNTIQSALTSVQAVIASLKVNGTITALGLSGPGGGGIPMRVAHTGGMITGSGVRYRGGFASGGQVPGRPPSNPRIDNLLAKGPNGLFGIRSREWVINQQASDYYGPRNMAAINNMQVDKRILGMAAGGQVGFGEAGGADSMIVELSSYDRQLLRSVADRPVVLVAEDRQIADSGSRGNTLAGQRGGT